VIEALPALKAAVAALLEARGARGVAALVAQGDLEVAGPAERWSMGSREVSAARLALVVDARAFAELTADATGMAAMKETFASAVRTPETELAELAVVLRLPGVGCGWHHAYREAAPAATPERPEPEAVLGGAAALLEARGDARGAAMLRRAQLETAPVPGGGREALLRGVVRLDPADRAALSRDAGAEERLRRAVREAGTRAAEAVASVELSTALRPLGAPETAEARLAAALATRGAVVVPIGRGEGEVELAVVVDGELCKVEITSAGGRELAFRAGQIRVLRVAEVRLSDAEQAHEVAALIGGHGGGR
jgi:hypothetical protein